MNVVERNSAPRGGQCRAEPTAAAAGPPRSARPAAAAGPLLPYVARYRWQASPRSCALLIAALATLAVPLAVRRMIDFGFSPSAGLIDSYFAVMIAVAGVLALASAARYYLVTTLGERIVADLRSEVFAPSHRALARLLRSGQDRRDHLAADRRHDADQGAVGSSVSVALRNIVLFVGAAVMMVVTSPRLSLFVLARDPGDRAAAGRLRPRGAAALAHRAGHARRCLGLCGRADRRDAHLAGLHQRDAGAVALRRARSSARSRPRGTSTRARAVLTAIVIFLVFGSVVVVLWVGAQDVLAGRITPGRLGAVRALCGVRRERARPVVAKSGANSRRRPAPRSG